MAEAVHRVLGIGTVGADAHLRARLDGQRQQPHDRFAVDALAAFRNRDLAGKPLGQLDKERGGPGVQPLGIDDQRLTAYAGHGSGSSVISTCVLHVAPAASVTGHTAQRHNP